eukprot:428087-Prymnesium_polylepis.1
MRAGFDGCGGSQGCRVLRGEPHARRLLRGGPQGCQVLRSGPEVGWDGLAAAPFCRHSVEEGPICAEYLPKLAEAACDAPPAAYSAAYFNVSSGFCSRVCRFIYPASIGCTSSKPAHRSSV